MSPEKLHHGASRGCPAAKRCRLFGSDVTPVRVVKFQAPYECRAGPGTQMERISWSDELWERFQPDQKDRLIRNLQRCTWKDFFAGMGSRNQLYAQIAATVNKNVADDIMIPLTYSWTEFNPVRQAFLGCMEDGHRARHLFGNILHRLGVEANLEIHRLTPDKAATAAARKLCNAKIAKVIDKVYEKEPATWTHSYCHLQQMQAFVDELVAKARLQTNSDNTAVKEDTGEIRCVSAGIPCVDVSPMNHHASGDGGRSFTAMHTFMAERRNLAEDMIFCECTKKFEPGILRRHLEPHGHRVWALHIRGGEVGDPYDRERLDMLALSPKVRLVRPLESFLLQAGSSPRFPVNSFWQNTPHEDQLEICEWSSSRITPVVDGAELAWDDVLLPSQKLRRNEYHALWQRMIDAGKCSETSLLIADLDHTPIGKDKSQKLDPKNLKQGHGRMVVVEQKKGSSAKFLPTMVQHGMWWNYELWKALGALDVARAHGWPLEVGEMEAVGCCAKIKPMLSQGVITHKNLVQMLGDSWALRPQGMLLMWLLSNLELVSESVGDPLRRLSLLPNPSPSSSDDKLSDDDFDDCRSMLTVSVSSGEEDARAPVSVSSGSESF